MFWEESIPTKQLILGLFLTPVILLGACAGSPNLPSVESLSSVPVPDITVLGENAHVTVVQAGRRDTLSSIAKAYYGDSRMSWLLAEQNKTTSLNQGDVVVIPKSLTNAVGVDDDGVQTVPILSYHRFGDIDTEMAIPTATFRRQLQYLKDEGFVVIPLQWMVEFLDGRRPLPAKSVVITVDDGYRSAFRVAFPILKEFDYPATIFIYSDFVAYGGLTWAEIDEMRASGLISIQAHAKTHRNLATTEFTATELMAEIMEPREKLQRGSREPIYAYAYPFGATTPAVRAQVGSQGYSLGLSVDRGGNPFYGDPLYLRRTMIYRSDPWERFVAALQVKKTLR
ncbi:MAG: polysaccharide deacetylase family protein [Pseudomonadota bacterium]